MGLWSYLERGGKRAIEIAHRRWGKDDVCLHRTATAAMERAATYWHMLPKQAQGRKAIWDAVNPHTGKRRIDEAFPLGIRSATRENEMMIRFRSGATWQVVGSDNYNSLLGSPPAGVVFSEWALADPASWAYINPILEENGGWALFITTPRGNNHAKRMLQMAQADPAWWAEVQSVDKTKLFGTEQLDRIRKEYVGLYGDDEGNALFEQEYFCSFEGAVIGSYYGKLIAQAERDGRVRKVPYDPALSVDTWWDLGMDDSMTIWFSQSVGPEIRFIDYLEHNGEGLPYYAKELQNKPYVYGRHIAPHDIAVRELGTGKSRKEVARELKIDFEVAPKLPVNDGIDQVRALLPKAWFDEKNCQRGIECLKNYQKEWDEDRKVFNNRPLHNWASHGADAIRTGAVARKPAEHIKLDLNPHPEGPIFLNGGQTVGTSWMGA